MTGAQVKQIQALLLFNLHGRVNEVCNVTPLCTYIVKKLLEWDEIKFKQRFSSETGSSQQQSPGYKGEKDKKGLLFARRATFHTAP